MKNLNFKVLVTGGVLALTSIVASCKKDLVKAPEKQSSSSKLTTNSAGDNLYDLLGFGYDVTGEYASSNSATYKVIDIEKLVQNEPNRYVPDGNVSQYAEYYAGGNAEDYSSSLSQSYSATLGLKVFGGTLKGSFKETTAISSKYSYASALQIIRQKRLKFSAPVDLIRANYLTASFKSDVSSMTAQQLVAKYGTHVLTDIILGAKLNLFYRSESSSSNKTKAVAAGMKANGLLKVFSISADVDYSTSDVNSNYNQTLYYSTVGGDGTKGLLGEISLDNSAPKLNIANWQSSCTRDNAALIQFGSKDALIALYDLIDDAAKKQAVQTYITQYLIDNQVKGLGDVPLYRYFNGNSGDHYYTTTANENPPNYKYEKIEAYVHNQQVSGTVPLYRYFNGSSGDHYYTTTANENPPNYKFEFIQAYVFPTQVTGTIPLYRYFNQAKGDHYYTTIPNENPPNYKFERIQAYVYSAN